jgi:hypothetical protein
VEHRTKVDADLVARRGGLATTGDRALTAEARRIGYRLDPYASPAAQARQRKTAASACDRLRTR